MVPLISKIFTMSDSKEIARIKNKITELNTPLALEKLNQLHNESPCTPVLGDFLEWPNGELSRFSQVDIKNGEGGFVKKEGSVFWGSFCLSGGVDFCGTHSWDRVSLNRLKLSKKTHLGSCWVFDRGEVGAGNRVDLVLQFRVFKML